MPAIAKNICPVKMISRISPYNRDQIRDNVEICRAT